MLIFFLYGVTVAEVSAVRLLARLHSEASRVGGHVGEQCHYVVATTKVTSGEGLIHSLIDALPLPPAAQAARPQRPPPPVPNRR